MQKAFMAVGADKQASFSADVFKLVQHFNRAVDGSMVVPSEYLEVVLKIR
jgi:hypothetical protein